MEETTFPEIVEQPVMWGYHRELHDADHYKAIVERDTKKVFCIATKDYQVIRHEQAIDQVEEAILDTPELGKYSVKTEFYNDKGRMRRTYVFPDISVEIAKNDTVNPEIQLFNSYDTTWPFIILLGAFRLVCSNGLVIGEKFLHIKKRHVFDFEQIQLNKQVSRALKRFELQGEEWKKWRNRQLTKAIYTNIMTAMKFGNNATEEIDQRITQKADSYDDYSDFPIMNLWVFFNVITWYITHRAVSLNHTVELDNRLRRSMAYFNK
jgi:hypothetical protein